MGKKGCCRRENYDAKQVFSAKKFKYIIVFIFFVAAVRIYPQYFGRNKVQYDHFNFEVLHTRHFDIHHYAKDKKVMNNIAILSERWYDYYHRLLNDTFQIPNPLVIYADHPDFQQTDVTPEFIDVGTGGFTEMLRQRLVMPLASSYAGTNHVLGHEMAHVFQYNLLRSVDSLNPRMLYNVPLWMVEGMAEYLSIGNKYSLTAMWMRDAVLRDEIPTLEKMTTDFKYNPYRYGHAAWAFIAGRWGDSIIPKLFLNTVRYGLEEGVKSTLGISHDSLSTLWAASLKAAYQPVIASRLETGKNAQALLSYKRRAGEMNLAPSVSPDGKYIVFVSEKDLFSIDLFLADAKTGKVIRKLTGGASSPHHGTLNFIESSGSWSPDGKEFVYPVYSKGDQKLLIVNAKNGRKRKLLGFKDIGSIVNPTWSPDGKAIVFSGTSFDQTDLYLYKIETQELVKLTDDTYSDLHPAWSPDGSMIAFVSDRTQKAAADEITYGEFSIFLFDVKKKSISSLPLFNEVRHINPQFSADGKSVFFISDVNGVSDIFRYELAGAQIFQVTNYQSGISGLTELSPAFSVSAKKGSMVFSVFENFQFNVYGLSAAKTEGVLVGKIADSLRAEFLPPFERKSSYVSDFNSGRITLSTRDTFFPQVKYKSKIKTDERGNVSVGGGASQFGMGLAGGAQFLFSDLLERHVIYTGLQLNGKVKDVGGQVLYFNRRHRFQWGAFLSHTPFLSASVYDGVEAINTGGAATLVPFTDYVVQRTYQDQFSFLTSYPVSQVNRFELNAGYSFYYFTAERRRYYDPRYEIAGSGQLAKLNAPPGFRLAELSAAFVGDNSFWGITEPLKGYRYRLEIGQATGTFNYSTLLADFRYYYRIKPFTIGIRGLHSGRYFQDADASILAPYFLGFEYFMRGYSAYSFKSSECGEGNDDGSCPAFDRLVGSKLAVINAELRLPFTGPGRLALIRSRNLFSSMSLFFDGGTTWTNATAPSLVFNPNPSLRSPVYSTGLSYRINFYNIMVMEFYLAYPFQRPEKGWHFGFQIMPGW
jgi:Tol biopolymer transport system component